MAKVIGRAGSSLNIRLGQSPDIKEPSLNYEFQQVFNSLHLLSQYMDVLRENLESAPGQTPAESVRFRRKYWAPALQNIALGAVVSAYGGGIVNGVATSYPATSLADPAITIGSTGSRRRFGTVQQQFMISTSAASAGQLVQIGVGPGILQVAGAKCGQIVWGVAALSIDTYRDANSVAQFLYGQTLINNGGIYLSNITARFDFTGGWYQWEGFWLPGYPENASGTFRYKRAFLYPIGVCVSDGYVIFSDYKRSDPLPDQSF